MLPAQCCWHQERQHPFDTNSIISYESLDLFTIFFCYVIFQRINKELKKTSSGPSTANRPSQLFFSKHLKIGSTLMRGHRLRSVYYITAQLFRSQYFLSPPSRVNGRESWRAASENRNLWRTVQKISRFVKTLGWQSRSRWYYLLSGEEKFLVKHTHSPSQHKGHFDNPIYHHIKWKV